MNKPTAKPTPTAMIIECLKDVADNHLFRTEDNLANACVLDAADRLESLKLATHKAEAEAEALHLQLLQLKAKHGEPMTDAERQKLVDFHRECASSEAAA